MNNRVLIMRSMYYGPIAVGSLRIALTLFLLVSHSYGFKFESVQVISLLLISWSLFSHCKLYTDSVPIIRMALPYGLHAALSYVFTDAVGLLHLWPFMLLDVIYLVWKTIKALLYPYAFEGDEDSELEEVLASFEID